MPRTLALIFFSILFFLLVQRVEAGNLTSISDLISTSRPTASALHVVKFTSQNAIPASSNIRIAFPVLKSGESNNPSSPSATTFQMNGLTQSSIKVLQGGTDITSNFASIVVNNPTVGTSPTIVFTLGAQSIPAGSVLTFFLGCTTLSGSTCTTPDPHILNPTKTAANGIADIWTLTATTSVDSGKTKIATQEGVNLSANVEPTFTFTIAGIPDGTSLNSLAYCGTSHEKDTTNSGISPTATEVNLENISTAASNSAAQLLTVATNASQGYTITTNSTGHLVNATNGAFFPNAQGDPIANNTPSPFPMTIGTASYGITACDAHSKVSPSFWGANGNLRFANPSATFLYTLVNSNIMPVAGGDSIVVMYRANAAQNTPAGVYRTVMTYVATAVF